MNKEFQNLALVDLTTPLGEDEVMPRNEHYVVPERPPAEQPKPNEKKAKKKKKAKSKHSSHNVLAEEANQEGDLLGFDSFGATPAATGVVNVDANIGMDTVAAPISTTTNNNPINNAFDDLLGLEMPTTIMESSNAMAQTEAAVSDIKPVKSKAKKQKKEKSKKKKKST